MAGRKNEAWFNEGVRIVIRMRVCQLVFGQAGQTR
jgi:hypothetical protein